MTRNHILTISGKDGDPGFTGYFPGEGQPGPGLIVLQEIYGVNEEVRRVADFYAGQGYRALAPDLLWRVESGLTFDYADRDAARDAIGRLQVADIVADVRSAGAALRRLVGESGKVGVLAFGWGAQHALAAARGRGFDAVVSYYPGNLAAHVPTAQGVEAPLLFHFSAQDFRTPPDLRAAFRKGLAERDNVEIYTYQAGDHGFANQSRPEYHEADARLADERTFGFLGRVLR